MILDLGCGNRKIPGAIGVDINENTSADIVHDLNSFPYPFEDSVFDEIYADNALEHLDDIVKVMEEIHRISKPNAKVKIIVPYFRARWAFIDPTHRHYFTVDSLSYFDPGRIHSQLYNYSTARFTVEKTIFNENIAHKGIMRPYFSFLKAIANRYPLHYEMYLSSILPLDDLTFYLRTIK